MRCWLMKSEPDEFGIDDLARRPRQREPWTGVRNYQARNFLRAMRQGDLAFFYHSSCPVPGVAGVVEITREAFPDPTQFDPASNYYDSASRTDNPRWFCVEVGLRHTLPRVITLAEIKAHAKQLQGLALLRPGNRLSVLPVEPAHWKLIVSLADR